MRVPLQEIVYDTSPFCASRPLPPYSTAAPRSSLFSTAASSARRVSSEGTQREVLCQPGRASSPSFGEGPGSRRAVLAVAVVAGPGE